MIRKPRKKFGGALGEAFDELWEAVEAGQIVESDSMTVDKTTRGTVVRAKVGAASSDGASVSFPETDLFRNGGDLRVFGNDFGNRHATINVGHINSSTGLPDGWDEFAGLMASFPPLGEPDESLPFVISDGARSVYVEQMAARIPPSLLCKRRSGMASVAGQYTVFTFSMGHAGVAELNFMDTGSANSPDYIGAFYGATAQDMIDGFEYFTASPILSRVSVPAASLVGLTGLDSDDLAAQINWLVPCYSVIRLIDP